MRILTLILIFTALPAGAGNLLTAEEFDAYTQGKTFTYTVSGIPYGREQYLPDRRVRWAFKGDECQEGEWFERAGLICFVYETEPVPQCWSFTQREEGLIARFEN